MHKKMSNLGLLILIPVSVFGQFTTTARHIGSYSSAPAACSTASGDIYYNTTTKLPYYCSATNTWTSMAGGGGPPTGAAGGDLGGTYPNPTVVKVQSGSGAPSGACTPGSLYHDTATGDLWHCFTSGNWYHVLESQAASGPAQIAGTAGATPADPSAGNFISWWDSATLTFGAKVGSTRSTTVVPTTCPGTNVVTGISSSGIPQCNTMLGFCTIIIGADNGSALANADLAQKDQCGQIPYDATLTQISIKADAGTPNIIVGRRRCTASSGGVCTTETVTNLVSSALAAASGGFLACAKTSAATGVDGVTTCSATLQNTAILSGDWIELVGGTAGGTAKRVSVEAIWAH